jgi:two-component system nitrogen regulation response regulator GlnG
LFGHERGAFTGADRRRIGKFEQCSGGTLFLDEIGDMSALTQAKVLRVLQDGRFERVGGNETIRADVRVIAATNRDLEQMVAAGEFRGDLFYRLGIVTIKLPPLRERAEDLPLLVDHFLKRFSPELGKEVDRISPEALEEFRRHSWPGNIRELQSVLKQALLRAQGPVLVADFLPASIRGEMAQEADPQGADLPWNDLIDDRLRAGSVDLYAETLALMERSLLTRVLRHTRGNQLQAAKILGITRGSLRTKIRTLGISIERSVWSGDGQTGR